MTEPTHIASELEALLSADGDGPAERIDDAAARRIVEHALAGAQTRPAVRSLRKRAGWLLAAALVLTGSAAAMYAAQRAVAPRKPPAVAEIPRALAPQPVQPAPVAPAVQPAVKTEPSERPAPGPAKNASEARVAQDLLERANRMRGEGRYRAAERTYLRVVAQNPSGAAGYAARVAAAGLRLDQLNDAQGALRLYDDALRASPAGPLAPEVHEGMAHAYRALKRPSDERSALLALLARQASGPAAERARQRLRVLDAGK
jgi:tetratricopeptide (TPR) repeat protein